MTLLQIIFWVLAFIVVYTYIGYGIVLYVMVRIKRLFLGNKQELDRSYQPDVTLFIAA